MTTELTKLREALRRVKHEAASLADAQVIETAIRTAESRIGVAPSLFDVPQDS